MESKTERDVEKEYPSADFVAKLRRLADALENGERVEMNASTFRFVQHLALSTKSQMVKKRWSSRSNGNGNNFGRDHRAMIFHSTSIRSRPHNAQDVRFAVMAALPDMGRDLN
jgi:hypothetical protein